MDNRTLTDLGTHLADLYQQRGAAAINEWSLEHDIELRKLELTPAEGWPGKNEELRETAREKTFAADLIMAELQDKATDIHIEWIGIQAEIEADEAERRALEWQTRARLVEALERKFVQSNGRGDVAESGFDDAAQAALDAEYARAAAYAAGTRVAAADSDELPF